MEKQELEQHTAEAEGYAERLGKEVQAVTDNNNLRASEAISSLQEAGRHLSKDMAKSANKTFSALFREEDNEIIRDFELEFDKIESALDLLNRYKAENEKLKAAVKRLQTRNDELNALNKTASIEAIKEFAELYESVIEQLLTSATIEQSYIIYKCLDKFKALSYRECTKSCNEISKESEEMVGDDNG